MRINKFIASTTDLSRRAADAAIAAGRVSVNGDVPETGYSVGEHDVVLLDGQRLELRQKHTTIMLNKPVGYVCSRQGQGSETIFELLPPEYQHLQPVGRLDKNSSGLLLLTDDGTLAHELTHPSRQKIKVYEVVLDKPLQPLHHQMICDTGITLEDGLSKLQVTQIERGNTEYEVRMHEGRNRQIRRTFAALGYTVNKLHRTSFGPYSLPAMSPGSSQTVTP